jgi:hypothetical protein
MNATICPICQGVIINGQHVCKPKVTEGTM